MYRKLLISSSIFLTLLFSLNSCFAEDNTMIEDLSNGAKNVVNNVQNVAEDLGRNISNTSKDVTGGIENKANELSNDVMNTFDNNSNTAKDTNNTVGTYNATRISTTDNTFMGMNSTAWIWLIIGIAAIAIIALVWYYSMQFNSSRYNDRD